MADQPQNPQSPNAGRISTMLQDLAAQRGDAPATPPNAPARPAPIVVGGPPPINLPTVAAPIAPRPAVLPVTPLPPKPVVPTPPKPAVVPSAPPAVISVPPRPTPPPAPREIAATQPPKPATPPLPPPPPPPAPVPVPAQARPTTSASSPQYVSEVRTMSSDLGRVQVGKPPAVVSPTPVAPAPMVVTPVVPAPLPKIPVPPPVAPPVVIPVIIPAAGSGGGAKKFLLFGLGLLVLAVVAVTAWSLLGSDTPSISPTPTPSTSSVVTATPREKTLASYFGLPTVTATLTSDETATTDFRNALLTAEPAARQGRVISVLRSGLALAPNIFLNTTVGQIPAEVEASLGSDWVAFAYGQTESFDAAGQPVSTTSAPQSVLAMVFEVKDASQANQAMQAWETAGLDAAVAKLLGYNPDSAIVEGFNSGTYREVSIRFRNFPFADRSLDWALTLGSNGKNYLILTGSRESIFFVVDQLMQ